MYATELDAEEKEDTINEIDPRRTIRPNTTIPMEYESGVSPSQDSYSKKKVIVINQKYRDKREKELKWFIGIVEDVNDETFKAKLEDLDGKLSFVEFENDFVSDSEKSLLYAGARFSYSIIKTNNYAGNREYRTKLSFDHKRKWFAEYEDKYENEAERIFPKRLLGL